MSLKGEEKKYIFPFRCQVKKKLHFLIYLVEKRRHGNKCESESNRFRASAASPAHKKPFSWTKAPSDSSDDGYVCHCHYWFSSCVNFGQR